MERVHQELKSSGPTGLKKHQAEFNDPDESPQDLLTDPETKTLMKSKEYLESETSVPVWN